MQVYILDRPGKSLQQMLFWLSEHQTIEEVECFNRYDEFLDKAEKQSPDICFIRIGYAEIPGIKATKMLKAIDSKTKVVFFSDQRDYALDAFEIGVNGYLLCPLEREKLDNCLAKVQKMNSS